METEFAEIEEWISNEKEISKLMPTLFTLLKKREALEESHPSLKYLRKLDLKIDQTVLPPIFTPIEPEKQSIVQRREEERRSSILLDNRKEIQGLPQRDIPQGSRVEKMLLQAKKRRQRVQREARKALQEKKRKERGIDLEEDLEPSKKQKTTEEEVINQEKDQANDNDQNEENDSEE